jgi:hypothetical protein
MYEELIGELHIVASGVQSKRRRELLEKAADAIEDLFKAAKKMHLWIFLNSGDEQAAYDWCGLSDEMNAALGYSGQFELRAEPSKGEME